MFFTVDIVRAKWNTISILGTWGIYDNKTSQIVGFGFDGEIEEVVNALGTRYNVKICGAFEQQVFVVKNMNYRHHKGGGFLALRSDLHYLNTTDFTQSVKECRGQLLPKR
jgi:hypothetical protein